MFVQLIVPSVPGPGCERVFMHAHRDRCRHISRTMGNALRTRIMARCTGAGRHPRPPTHQYVFCAVFYCAIVPFCSMPYKAAIQGSQAPNYPGQQLASARSAEKTLENTQTIRNCVNLKKATLRVVPLAGNFKELAILFSFDATHPCMCVPRLLCPPVGICL